MGKKQVTLLYARKYDVPQTEMIDWKNQAKTERILFSFNFSLMWQGSGGNSREAITEKSRRIDDASIASILWLLTENQKIERHGRLEPSAEFYGPIYHFVSLSLSFPRLWRQHSWT